MEVKEFEMPDGSKVSVPKEKWELINEYTVSEDCTTLTIDKDQQNKGFNLKKILVRAKFIPTSEEPDISRAIKLDLDSDHSAGWSSKIAFVHTPKPTEKSNMAQFIGEISNGLLIVGEQRTSFNNTTVPNILNYKTDYNYCSITFDDNLLCGNIEKIDMVRLTGISVAIGQGSKIKIWGVRA